MKKKLNNIKKELEDTIIDSDFKIPILKKINFESNHKIISFISEFMSLPLNEKISHYLINKNIRTLKNPLTFDTILHYICINDDNIPLIKLIKPNLEEIENKNNLGQNLLHISVQNRCEKITKYLIDNNADVNSNDNKKNTPLHIAVKNDDYNMVKLLMLYNAKINIFNNDNENPVDIARKKGNKLIINYLENKENQMNKVTIMDNKESFNNIIYKDNIRNSYNQNTSLNNFSDETKNETENQSLNVYRKKIIQKDIKTPLAKKMKANRTINLNLNFNQNENTPKKKSLNRYIMEPKLLNNRNNSGFINNGKLFKEKFNNSKSRNRSSNMLNISPENLRYKTNNIIYPYKIHKNELNINTKRYQKQNNYKSMNNSKLNIKKSILQNNQNYIPLSHLKKIENKKIRKRNQKQMNINYTFNNVQESRIKKEEKDKLTEFLKEIGMQHYTDILISEGFDDIDLIIKQMKEGFPSLYLTLKEIGIDSPGDRAKILVHMQEISNGFTFEFPFEIVYFKNNRSIQKWLNKEELSKYINNFIDAGYQSLELLLIQMASKYKITEQILRNEIFINNEEDIKKIIKSLETNSEKYVYQLSKNHNVQRTYSKMVNNNNSQSLCIII